MKEKTGPGLPPGPDDVAFTAALLAASPDRVELIRSLLLAKADAAKTVADLAEATGAGRGSVGASLRTLHNAGLVQRAFRGRVAEYWPRRELRAASAAIDRAAQALQGAWR